MSLNLISHSLPDSFSWSNYHGSQYHTRTSVTPISVHCNLQALDDAQPPTTASIARRRNLECRAVTGGSRRDVEKLLARTQHRRTRHVKGVTPSKPELLKELEEEAAAEEEVQMVAELATEDSTSSPYEIISSNSSASKWVKGAEMGVPLQQDKVSMIQDLEGQEGAFARSETSANQGVETIPQGPQDNQVNAPQSVVPENGIARQQPYSEPSCEHDELGSAIRTVSDVAEDTAADTVRKAEETEEEVGKNLSETLSVGQNLAGGLGNSLNGLLEEAVSEVVVQADEAGPAVSAIADVVMDTVSDTGNKIKETGQEVGEDLAEVASSGQSIFEDCSKALSEQAQVSQAQARKALKEEGERLEQGSERISSGAHTSLTRMQDSVTRAVEESARAAESVGREALGFGELIVDTAKETINSSSSGSSRGARRGDGVKTQQGRQNSNLKAKEAEIKIQDHEKSRYTDFKVLVAGASGRTGRLIVENLVSKGAGVRALVRDAYKARSIQQLKDVEVVEADLYKSETLKQAIGDCNVLICAVGAQGFPLDPFSAYQVEYEGVLNLVSAAKNHGKVKKFVFLSSIGVTFFQLIPLLFWKKQAELYLQRSGLDYTIVRPGGLRSASNDESERVVMRGADSQFFGGISREKVAEVCVAALVAPCASDKIVEVVAETGKQTRSIEELFSVL